MPPSTYLAILHIRNPAAFESFDPQVFAERQIDEVMDWNMTLINFQ